MKITTRHLLIILAAVGFFVYAVNLNNSLFWDDDDWILNNPYVHDLSHLGEIFSDDVLAGIGLSSNYYRPFLLVTFAFNYVLGGENPIGYHLVSNAIHVLNGFLLFLLLLRALGQRWVAFAAALIFLIHPLQTEAVTYISGRGDPLSLLFMLGALAFIVFRPLRSWYSTGLALVAMVLGILSRETAVLLPVLIVLWHMAFQSHERFVRSLWDGIKKAIPFFAVSAVYMLLRLTVLNFKNTLNFYDSANVYSEHLAYRLYTFGRALLEYFRLMVWPTGLHMERELPVYTSLFQWPIWLAALILIGIVATGIMLYRRQRTMSIQEAGPVPFRIWFFGWTWFFVFLAPVSGLIPINAILYEHWLYGALIGPVTIVCWASYWLIKRLSYRGTLVSILAVLAGIYGIFLMGATVQRNLAWGNPIAFYEDILRYSPKSVRINNNLGNLYNKEGDLEKAIFYYQRAIASEDIFAQPHYNIGVIYLNQKNFKQAKEEFLTAIRVDPSFYYAYQNLAYVLVEEKDYQGAARILEQLKVIRPVDPAVYYNLAVVYASAGDMTRARTAAQQGLSVARTEQEKRILEELLTKLQ